MKIARRIVAIMLASLMTFALLAGCGEQAPAADDSAAIVASETSVEVAPVVEEVAVVEEAVVEEVASAGTADSDVVEEVRLYMIDSYGWNTFESSESAVIPASGGTFTLSVTADEMNFMRIASVYLKDYSCRLGSTSKSQFASATITLDKVTFNGAELSLTNNGAEEAVGSNGVFDYCFINQWYTPGLKVSNCVIPEGQGSFMFDGVEYLDGRNTMEVTFTIAPIANDKILTFEDTLRQLQGIAMNTPAKGMTIGETAVLVCNTNPVVCKDYIYGFDSKVVWSTSDASIVTVDNTGAIAAVAEGTATITASYENYTASCTITVLPDTPSSIVSLYLQSTSSWSNYASDPNAISETGTYTFTITGTADDFSTIGAMYLKDIEAYALGDDLGDYCTAYPGALVDILSVTLNGVEMALNADMASDMSGYAAFDIQIINGWWMDGTVVEDAGCDIIDGWRPEAYFTDEDGNISSAYVDGENTIEVTINVTDLNQWD